MTATRILAEAVLTFSGGSGVFFPVQAMPMPLPYVAKALPLTHATEALRAIEIWNLFVVSVDIMVLLLCAIGTILLGSQS